MMASLKPERARLDNPAGCHYDVWKRSHFLDHCPGLWEPTDEWNDYWANDQLWSW